MAAAPTGIEPGSEGAEPTNWEVGVPWLGVAVRRAQREYYLHLFSPKQPDLNWENPEVRRGLRHDELVG